MNTKPDFHAEIELLKLVVIQPGRTYMVHTRLKNNGRKTWMPMHGPGHTVSIALTARTPGGQQLTSDWFPLHEEVRPGRTVEIEAELTIAQNTADHLWEIDMVADGICWLSSCGTKTVPVKLASAKQAPAMNMDQVKYLEKIIDTEDGPDKGPISGKEILVYGPGKTGTVSLFLAIENHFRRDLEIDNFKHKMLHSHNNRTIIENTRYLSPDIDRHFLENRKIVRDMVEYKRLTGQSVVIVSSFREPLSRAISGVFENINQQVFINRTADAAQFDQETCRDMLLKALRYDRHPIEDIEPALFDEEHFDKDKKCLYLDRGHYRILMVCIEHSDRWQDILETELGYKGIHVQTRNRASDKQVAGMYADFKSGLRLAESTIREIYHSGPSVKYLKWFYTDDEIANFADQALRSYAKNSAQPTVLNIESE